MLRSLHIKNFAIIDEQNIEFDTGLNIIIGETGAGKSIILDAIGILLGKRASQDMIRKGEEKSIIEGVFTDEQLKIELDSEVYAKEFTLRKEIRSNGSSRLFLNDTPVQLSEIKNLSTKLANYHSQDENIVLRDEESHIEFYDDFIEFDGLIEQYMEQKDNLQKEHQKLKKLLRDKDSSLNRKDFLEYQLAEINKINPKEGELAEVNDRLQIIENSEEILMSSQELSVLTNGDEEAIYSKLRRVVKLLEEMGKYSPEFLNYLEELNSAVITINELGNVVADFSSNINYDAIETENLRKRSVELRNLEKKYGTIGEILEKKSEIEDELSTIENYDTIIEDQRYIIGQLELKIGVIASKISKLRRGSSQEFGTKLVASLQNMGITEADFEVEIMQDKAQDSEPKAMIDGKSYKLYEKGIDRVCFLAAMNKGEGLKKLSEFASGGELSRILLSLKGNKISEDTNPVLILDEIDTGISGRVSQLVGQQMRRISQKTQIIAITHSPQIAAAGNSNFVVSKKVVENRTLSVIEKLNDSNKALEIAKLISGADTTQNSLESAKELINSSTI